MASDRDAAATDVVDQMIRQWERERPDLDPSGLEVALRMPILADYLAAGLRACLASHGLAALEFDVLSALRRMGEPFCLSPTELCQAARLSSGAMTNRIDRLEQRKFVVRRADDSDRRSVAVALTARGRKVIDAAIATRMEQANAAVQSLQAKERRHLSRLLRTLIHAAEDGALGSSSPVKE